MARERAGSALTIGTPAFASDASNVCKSAASLATRLVRAGRSKPCRMGAPTDWTPPLPRGHPFPG